MPSEGWVAWVIEGASTPYGGAALFFNAVAESSFFSIPPDVLLTALSILCPPSPSDTQQSAVWDRCWVVS
jgi:membrane protein YqaA with SNARE-associated domain